MREHDQGISVKGLTQTAERDRERKKGEGRTDGISNRTLN
jgi:hypothetical protein